MKQELKRFMTDLEHDQFRETLITEGVIIPNDTAFDRKRMIRDGIIKPGKRPRYAHAHTRRSRVEYNTLKVEPVIH